MKFKNTIKTLALACLMMMGAVVHAVPLVPGTSFGSFGVFTSQGDFNGDGNMDLVESSGGSPANAVRVSLADGLGGFTVLASQTFSLLTNVNTWLTYDMDGDTRADVLIQDNGGVVYKALGFGDGTFATPIQLFTLPTNARLIDAVNMNGDGIIDFVAYDGVANKVVVILAASPTAYAPPVQYPSLSVSGGAKYFINVADLDGDGFPDVAVQSSTPNHLAVLLGDGTGVLGQASIYPLSTVTAGSGLADLNGDTFLDFVASIDSTTSDSVAVLLNDGAGAFGAETLYPLGGTANSTSYQLEIADFNLDGKPDVLAARNQKVTVLLGDGAGGFAAPLSFISGVATNIIMDVVVGDINGDTKPDVVVKGGNGIGLLSLSNYPLINMSTTNLITGTITINAGAATTEITGVTLGLNCVTSTGAVCASSTTMELSNDRLIWTPAAPWAVSAPWALDTGLGVKTVSVRFTDVSGNISTASDTIEVVLPSASGGGCLAASQSSTLYLFMLFGLLFAALQMRSRC